MWILPENTRINKDDRSIEALSWDKMENMQDRQTVDISPSERFSVHMDEEEVGIEGKHEVEKVDLAIAKQRSE